MASHSFPKRNRLRRRREFQKVQNEPNQKVASGVLLALLRPNSLGVTRLGLTVSSKVGNAVVRNRIRRHLREWFRLHQDELVAGQDIVVVARTSSARATQKQLHQAIERATGSLQKKI